MAGFFYIICDFNSLEFLLFLLQKLVNKMSKRRANGVKHDEREKKISKVEDKLEDKNEKETKESSQVNKLDEKEVIKTKDDNAVPKNTEDEVFDPEEHRQFEDMVKGWYWDIETPK